MWRPFVLLIALCSITFFAGLGRPAIADSDEAFYAEAAREMLAAGDWITPQYNYEHRFQKPILFYWFAGVSYLLSGVSEFAARLPAALAGLGLSLVTYLYGRRVTNDATALLAGAIAATSFGYFSMARQALPDLPLAFFITAATWSLFESIDATEPRYRRRWAVGAAVATAAGFLTKGPVGIALPLIVVLPFAARMLYRSEDRTRRAGDLAAAAAVFLVLTAPWFIAMANRHGVAYLDRFFVGENLDRFATDRYNDPRPIWFYLPIVAGGMLPWSPFMLLWVSDAVAWLKGARKPSPLTVRLIVWSLAPLVFFTVSVGKQPRYILPMLPPLALLLARSIMVRLHAGGARDPLLAASGALAGVLLVALGALSYRARPLLLVVSAGWIGVAAVLIGTCGLMVLIVALSRRQSRLPLAITAAGAVTLASLHYAILSTSGPEPVQRLAADVSRHHRGADTVGTYRVFVRNLIFYTHIQQTDLLDEAALTKFLEEHRDALVVVPRDDLARVERTSGVIVRRLAEVPYFNTAGLKLRMLLWPDPARDLDVVVLVRPADARAAPPTADP